MPSRLLTDRLCASRPSAARVTFFDTKARGLALRIGPRRRTWHFVYRYHAGPPRWLTLGTYPELTLEKAREAAGPYRYALDVEDRDPGYVEPPEPAPVAAPVLTFADFAKVYIGFAALTKRTWRDDQAKIEKYLVPAWGPLPLRDISRRHVADLLDTLVAKGLTVGVNRIQALISRIFTLALDRGAVDAHPATRLLKRAKEVPRERTLTDDEIRALWIGLEAQPGPAADVIKLRLLLGQRGGETAGMTWADVDLVAKTWHLPATATKNARPHTVPLPDTALAILTRRRADTPDDEPRVFPAHVLQTDSGRSLSALLPAGAQWTDTRRTCATRLAALGYSETVIGRTLNHARYTVTARHYNQHAYVGEMRAALESWDRELARIVADHPKTGADVLPMVRGPR